MEILILKTGSLGDVLRTTSILPGLHARYSDARITWLAARGAEDLVRFHPLVSEVVVLESLTEASLALVRKQLEAVNWGRVLSFDDDAPLCELASALGGDGGDGVLSGAFARASGELAYTPDTARWYDMGLLSVHGRAAADEKKLANRGTHREIYAEMLGIEPGVAELPIGDEASAFAEEFFRSADLHVSQMVIGLNTGAGGRWESKRLSVDCTVALMRELHGRFDAEHAPVFVLLGGREEAERNAGILGAVCEGLCVVDAGVKNELMNFAALIGRLDLLITSDSLGLHVAIAGEVPVVVFFAPTSPAEIELFGRGEKVVSEAPDAGTYRSDVDTSTLTPKRLADAAERVLGNSSSRKVS